MESGGDEISVVPTIDRMEGRSRLRQGTASLRVLRSLSVRHSHRPFILT
jgi:hypothetical protein